MLLGVPKPRFDRCSLGLAAILHQDLANRHTHRRLGTRPLLVRSSQGVVRSAIKARVFSIELTRAVKSLMGFMGEASVGITVVESPFKRGELVGEAPQSFGLIRVEHGSKLAEAFNHLAEIVGDWGLWRLEGVNTSRGLLYVGIIRITEKGREVKNDM